MTIAFEFGLSSYSADGDKLCSGQNRSRFIPTFNYKSFKLKIDEQIQFYSVNQVGDYSAFSQNYGYHISPKMTQKDIKRQSLSSNESFLEGI